jgi:hypothetical protein
MSVRQVTDEEFMTWARQSGHPVPIEQAPEWDAFDARVAGRTPWRRLAVSSGGGAPSAVIAFTAFAGRGFRYLWAKHGPIWLDPQTPEAEAALRTALRAYVAAEAPDVAFLRIHATTPAPDLHELLQTVTYDETVVVDLTPPVETIMAGFSKSARKKLRRTLEDTAMVCSDETGLDRVTFDELYAIYQETADRSSFGIYDADVYFAMLESLGGAARVFVARRTDAGDAETPRTPGRAVAWIISTVFDGVGVDYFGGGNAESLETNAALRLKWHIFTTLKSEGVGRYDLMGVGSARAPQLMGVRQFKLQFADGTTPVDGAWDVPVRDGRYALLVRLLGLKHALGGLLGRVRRPR